MTFGSLQKTLSPAFQKNGDDDNGHDERVKGILLATRMLLQVWTQLGQLQVANIVFTESPGTSCKVGNFAQNIWDWAAIYILQTLFWHS